MMFQSASSAEPGTPCASVLSTDPSFNSRRRMRLINKEVRAKLGHALLDGFYALAGDRHRSHDHVATIKDPIHLVSRLRLTNEEADHWKGRFGFQDARVLRRPSVTNFSPICSRR